MSFTSDIWSDSNSNAFLLSLTCHRISENFERSSNILKSETFRDRHTEDSTADTFDTILFEWDIEKDQEQSLTQNEGSNMKKVARIARFSGLNNQK